MFSCSFLVIDHFYGTCEQQVPACLPLKKVENGDFLCEMIRTVYNSFFPNATKKEWESHKVIISQFCRGSLTFDSWQTAETCDGNHRFIIRCTVHTQSYNQWYHVHKHLAVFCIGLGEGWNIKSFVRQNVLVFFCAWHVFLCRGISIKVTSVLGCIQKHNNHKQRFS